MVRPIVLVTDDDPDSANILGTLLALLFPDATVCVTHGGQAGLAQASTQRPDAAVLDLEMPGMNGQQLALALRAVFPRHPPLLIALSGNLLLLEEIRGNGVFDQHLSKPVDVDALERLLAENFAQIDLGL